MLRHAQRIVELARQAPYVVGDLERAEAPWHAFRWVAWDDVLEGCRQRAKLAIHLHQQLPGRRGGWLQERHLTAAFAVWEQARAAARKRGGIMPAVDQIPLDDYRHAIETAPRRRRAHASSDEPVRATGGEPEFVEALDADPACAMREVPPPAQMQVVRYFALAVRTALEAHDLRAAQVANDAILRLAGEPEDDEGETEEATTEQTAPEEAAPEPPAQAADRDASPERPTTGAQEAGDAAATTPAGAVTDTRPLIDILLGR
jgi:hypothetical protein